MANSHFCPNCRTNFRTGAKFCRQCGLDLQTPSLQKASKLYCSKCGCINSETARFCARCGSKLSVKSRLLRRLNSWVYHPGWRDRRIWAGIGFAVIVILSCLFASVFSKFVDRGFGTEITPFARQVDETEDSASSTVTQEPVETPYIPEETGTPIYIPGLEIELPRVTDSEEIEIGQEAVVEFEREFPTSTDNDLIMRVTRIGEKIVPHQPRENIPFTFKVVDIPEINAFALPGGHIYVTRGMLEFVQSDDELAGVIGHEIAHVSLRHGAQQIEVITAGQIALDKMLAGNSNLANIYQEEMVKIAGELATQIALNGWGRYAELDADEYGTIYMTKAGYDPRAVISMLRGLESLQDNQHDDTLEMLLATHPPFDDRIERVEQTIEEMGF